MFIHAVLPFLDLTECREVVIAAPANSVSRFTGFVAWYLPEKPVRVVKGGRTRQESVGLALAASGESSELILVHDAARPFSTRELIQRVAAAVKGGFAASAPALPLTDTVKRAHGDPLTVERTVERRMLYSVQTPQALLRDAAEEAYRRLRSDPFDGTDDVSLVEHFDLGRVCLVEGDPRNIKITTTADLQYARERVR